MPTPALSPYGITLDGVSLNTFAYAVATRTGWDASPGKVGENARIPGRDGQVWRAKDYEPGRIVLEVLVTSTGADGTRASGVTAAEQHRANMDALMVLIGRKHALLQIEKATAEGTRRNFGEVTAVIEPEYPGDDEFAVVKVELTLPDPLWRDATTTDVEPTGSATSPRTIALTGLAGSTAPITDATILVVGPITNPRVIDTVSGAWVQYTGTVSSSQVWRINAETFTSEVGTGLSYTGGSASSVLADTTFNPGPRFLTITPAASTLTPSLTLSGTSTSSATTVKVRAYRKYLT